MNETIGPVGRPLPAWFAEARLGIFIHWGPYSIPGWAPVGLSPLEWQEQLGPEEGSRRGFTENSYAEWYENSLGIAGSPTEKFHLEHYGADSYERFGDDFQQSLDGWDPRQWARSFAAAGASYVVVTTKHHDGFLLWPSAIECPRRAGWQCRRDVVGELADAVRDEGMRFGVYYSGGLDWRWGGIPIVDGASLVAAIPRDPDYGRYIAAHFRDLIERYQPSVLWNDIHYPWRSDVGPLLADYYDAVPDGVVNDRFDMAGSRDGRVHADVVTPEYSSLDDVPNRPWELCRGIGQSFGWNRAEADDDLLSPEEVIALLDRVNAKGGKLLLNVGPDDRAQIPLRQQARLDALAEA